MPSSFRIPACPRPKHPALTYALRGIAALEITLHGPSRDLHSGIFGGTVDNPAMALCQLLAKLRDQNGRITIPGFYDDVQPALRLRAQAARPPARQRAGAIAKFLGVPELFGERGFTPVEQRSARPTFEINGLTSGYQGEGSKTIIPPGPAPKSPSASSRISSPRRIIELVRDHSQETLSAHRPPGNQVRPRRANPIWFPPTARRPRPRCARSKPPSAVNPS